jgi:hypothetical protein
LFAVFAAAPPPSIVSVSFSSAGTPVSSRKRVHEEHSIFSAARELRTLRNCETCITMIGRNV